MPEEIRLKTEPPHIAKGPFQWGAWDGALAIVDLYKDRFDARTCERLFVVRFATVDGKWPVPSMEYDIGMPVSIARPDLPYTQTTFKLGRFGQRRFIPMGGFTEAHLYRIPVALKAMSDQEHRCLRRQLDAARYTDTRESKLPGAAWRKLTAREWLDIQAGTVGEANEVDRLLSRLGIDTTNDVLASAAWDRIRRSGLFAETRAGRIKWMIPGNE